jgi:DNA polymerase-3 subunit delta'
MSLSATVVGHEKPKQILQGLLSHRRMATTYLFSGEQGVGKRLAAIEFSKAINCTSHDDSHISVDACDRCSSCRRIASRNHPDLKIVEPEKGLIKIDTIRAIQEFLSFSPYEGKKKIVIIDDAECMNQAASNAFLKTLEEPPPESIVILITRSHDMLLATIRSRCFQIRFSLLNRHESLSVLREQMHEVEDEDLEQLVRYSMGRPGTVFRDEYILMKEKVEILVKGLSQGESFPQLKDRVEMEDWLNKFIIVLRDLLILRIDNGNRELVINFWFADRLSEISKKMNIQDIMNLYNETIQLMRYFRFNLNTSILANYLNISVKDSYGNTC